MSVTRFHGADDAAPALSAISAKVTGQSLKEKEGS